MNENQKRTVQRINIMKSSSQSEHLMEVNTEESYSEPAQICRFCDVQLFKARKFPVVLPCLSTPALLNRAATSRFEIFTILGGFGQRDSMYYPSALLYEYEPERSRRRGR